MRPSWDKYFMGIAFSVAKRSTCDRKRVGAVIVWDRNIVSTGYNGAIKGMPHCDDGGHWMSAGHCVRVVHAELNAILQAAKLGLSTNGATIYTTTYPCWECFKAIVNAGIIAVYYSDIYRPDEAVADTANILGITLEQVIIDESK